MRLWITKWTFNKENKGKNKQKKRKQKQNNNNNNNNNNKTNKKHTNYNDVFSFESYLDE